MEAKQYNKYQIGEKQLNSTVESVIMEYIFHSIPIFGILTYIFLRPPAFSKAIIYRFNKYTRHQACVLCQAVW